MAKRFFVSFCKISTIIFHLTSKFHNVSKDIQTINESPYWSQTFFITNSNVDSNVRHQRIARRTHTCNKLSFSFRTNSLNSFLGMVSMSHVRCVRLHHFVLPWTFLGNEILQLLQKIEIILTCWFHSEKLHNIPHISVDNTITVSKLGSHDLSSRGCVKSFWGGW